MSTLRESLREAIPLPICALIRSCASNRPAGTAFPDGSSLKKTVAAITRILVRDLSSGTLYLRLGSESYLRRINWHGNGQQTEDDVHQPMSEVSADEAEFVVLPAIFVPVIPRSSPTLSARDFKEGL